MVVRSENGRSQRTLQQGKKDLSPNRALVDVIENYGRICAEVGISDALSLEHAVRHIFDLGLWARAVFEANGESDTLAELATDLLGDAFGGRNGGFAAGLRAPDASTVGVPVFSEVLGDLSRLARARDSCDDQDLMLDTASV